MSRNVPATPPAPTLVSGHEAKLHGCTLSGGESWLQFGKLLEDKKTFLDCVPSPQVAEHGPQSDTLHLHMHSSFQVATLQLAVFVSVSQLPSGLGYNTPVLFFSPRPEYLQSRLQEDHSLQWVRVQGHVPASHGRLVFGFGVSTQPSSFPDHFHTILV